MTTVRYFVTDVDEAVDFYCNRLGFHVDLPLAPGFAGLAKDDLRLLLHEPGAGGAGQAGGVPSLEVESVPDRRCRSGRDRRAPRCSGGKLPW